MTRLSQVKVTCGLCGHRSRQTRLLSTCVFGSPDLDLRPPPRQRSILRLSVQACPSCGYVAPAIKRADAVARETVETDAYQALRVGPLGETLAGRFLRAALIARHRDDLGQAGEMTLYAAWTADDDGDDDQARAWRSDAADLIGRALETMDPDAEVTGHTATRLVDVLRRAGRFDETKSLADHLLTRDLDPVLTAVLTFERHKAEAGDTACYTVDQVFAGPHGSVMPEANEGAAQAASPP